MTSDELLSEAEHYDDSYEHDAACVMREAASEIVRLRVDAERYRWLRENVNSSRAVWNQHCGGFDVLLTTEELDWAIDAAMENNQ